MASIWKFNRCYFCGRRCVPCVDNFGLSYLGCPSCVIVDPSKQKGGG